MNYCHTNGRSNSTVVACVPVMPTAPGSKPVVGGACGNLFLAPSTLETMYLLCLAWPCKWWCCLTDFEWDIKEPLRRRSSLPGSDHPQCLYMPVSLGPQRKQVFTLSCIIPGLATKINKQTINMREGTYPRVCCKVLHEDRGHLCKVRGAPGPRDMLVPGPAQHGVDGMAALMEEVLNHARGEQGWDATAWRRQIHHQHYYWILQLG